MPFRFLTCPISPYAVHRRGVRRALPSSPGPQADAPSCAVTKPRKGLPYHRRSPARTGFFIGWSPLQSFPRLVMRVRRRQPAAVDMLWYGPYRPLQSGVESGSVLLLSQFNLERGSLAARLVLRDCCAGATHLHGALPSALANFTQHPRRERLHSRSPHGSIFARLSG
jgi:hypothetical protein